MLKIKTRKICPKCGVPQELTYKWIRGKEYGKTIKTCAACHTKYVDVDCYEPALKNYDDYYAEIIVYLVFAELLIALDCGIVAVIINIILSVLLNIEMIPMLFWITFIATLALLTVYEVYSNKKSGGLRKLWEESDARLKNVDYAIMLANYGFDVPERYLPSRRVAGMR